MLGAFIFVSGCDNTNQLDSHSVDEQARISAQNAIYSTVYSDSYEVDLSDNVTFSGSDGFAVSNVEALSTSPECQVQSMTQTGFTISANISKACDYKYEVVLSDNQQVSQSDNDVSIARMAEPLSDSAITRIAVSRMAEEEGSVELTAISATTLIEQSVVVNVSQELQRQTGYTLSPDFTLSTDLTLPYSSASATADPGTNTIDYTPPAGFEGIERILYSYIDDITGDVLLGALDIAVTYQANQGLEVQSHIYHDPVPLNSLETIDVSPYVTSFDGDDFQLVYVNAYNAATEVADPLDVSNTSFTFITSEMKYHYVSFAVTDHKGAYATGMMQVPAYDSSNVGQWDSIKYDNVAYLKPLTTTESMNNDLDRAGYIEDLSYTPPVTLSLYRWLQTDQCSQVGRLATVSEMQALQSTNIRVTYNWPTTTLYWADDGGMAKTIDMTTGEVASPIGSEYLITCIIITGVTAEVVKTDAVANMTDSAEIRFNYTEQAGNTAEIVAVENQLITITTDSATAQTAASVFTDADGNAVVHVTNTKAEEVEVCGEVGTSTSCVTVSFIGDTDTAEVKQAAIDTAGWVANDATQYQLEIKVRDAYENPISGVLTKATKVSDANDASSLTLLNNTAVTNDLGIATIDVTNTEIDIVDVTEIEVTHINSLQNESKITLETTWGGWNWNTPLEVLITARNDRTLDCTTVSGGYRELTSGEIQEYIAYVNGSESLELGDPLWDAYISQYTNQIVSITNNEMLWMPTVRRVISDSYYRIQIVRYAESYTLNGNANMGIYKGDVKSITDVEGLNRINVSGDDFLLEKTTNNQVNLVETVCVREML
ncbi:MULTISPECIES: Ig-like domain-containing protein [Aliivibrio]|uniref:Big-1 domain-containing protein n=1 Tax=Aliivibrio finisterrensis TaxID=511998 RepID=A0A4V1Z998_9GAMM|nr:MULTISPECIES: Ig-like domain-containing protein [Aliivibrio]MDD9177267.1 Ig-like domain-containing protein [Aliivibrio sp. A6]RYU54755.1 hypothetical protein ERW57_00460 [Aliivibrio finisterrensis]RYU56429.1 hypothetical protein ERW56_00140 [Aliivibrio finisterrensis]RYU66861.1 hypothetical protein ERW53_01710 [Aliivibrio finisterrensis]RYU88642.1 hypothetical protein ERW52_01910 [Aliivibrio finisterrensis]